MPVSKVYHRLFLATIVVSLFTLSADTAWSDTVRVRILEEDRPQDLRVSVEDGSINIFVDGGSRAAAVLASGEEVIILREQNRLHISWSDGSVFTSAVELKTEGPDLLNLRFRVPGTSSEVTRTYRGNVVVSPNPSGPGGPLMIVNHVDVESYVASVVASEYPFGELEGVKAQAVVARTYALRSSPKFSGAHDHTDHVMSQVYRGAAAETEISRRATQLTSGEVLTYQGELIEAVYSSTCGGHTANNEDVWDGQALPYLRAKPDPFDAESPHSSWQTTVSRSALLDLLSNHYDTRVAGILLIDHTAEGRARNVRLLGNAPKQISANDFRLVVNRHFGPQFLRSTFLSARIDNGDYVFEGRGFGHGVGLCQYGAHGKALQGHDYQTILEYFYAGAQLTSREGPALADVSSPTRGTDSGRNEEPNEAASGEIIARSADDGPPEEVEPAETRRERARQTSRPQTRRVGW